MNTELKTRRVGGSLMIPIPADVVKIFGLHAGQTIPAVIEGGKLILEPAKRHLTYADLLAMCDLTAEQDPAEVAWQDMRPVGREALDD